MIRLSRLRAAGVYLLSATLALAVLSCSDSGSRHGVDGESTLDRLRRTGTARVGYANEAPYAYMDESGRLTGEAPEIAREVLSRLGVPEIEGVLTEFGSLIPGLKAGRFDIIAAGMYITPERCREIAFSSPTYGIGEAFLVADGNPLDLHGYGSLAEHESATLGVVAGTVERTYARKMGVPDDRVVVFPDPPSAVAGVAAGRVDAYAGTSLTVRDLLGKSSAGVEQALPFDQPQVAGELLRGYGAFGLRPEDEELLAAINEELASFIGSPEHAELVRPFGFGPEELPGEITVAELCAD